MATGPDTVGDLHGRERAPGFAARRHQASRWRTAIDVERDRFFLWTPVAFGAGIAAYFALPHEPHLSASIAPLAIAIVVSLAMRRGTIAAALMTAITLAAAGFTLAKLRVDAVAGPVLSKPMRNVEVSGIVIHAERRGERGQRLTIAVEKIGELMPADRPERVRIRTLSGEGLVSTGDRVSLRADIRPPAMPAVPGAFDFARTAWFERIGAVGYAFRPPVKGAKAPPATVGDRMAREVEALRTAISDRVRAALPGEAGAIATALITGERGGISEETNEEFKGSGLFHILSISGLHMVVMAGAVFFLVRLSLAAAPSVALRLPIKKLAAVCGILAAFFYLAVSGGAFATVRAALMISIMFLAVILDRPALALRNVALSALAILAVYPESLFDAGFQMSFAAVTALVSAYEAMRRARRRRPQPTAVMRALGFFGGIVASTLIASIAVAPFAAYHFHQSQQYALLANLIAIPICNFVVMPCALLTLLLMPFGLEALALQPMGLGISAMSWCAEAVSRLPGAVGRVPAIPTAAFALMTVGGLWVALWSRRQRWLGVGAVAAGLAVAPLQPRPDLVIARDGALTAIRLPDGRLSSLPSRSSEFEMQRMLDRDGDARKPAEALRGEGFTCDAVSCVASVKGVSVAAPRRAAALVDDCARARVLVLNTPAPGACDGPEWIADLFSSWRDGGYALFIEQGTAGGPPDLRIETVASHRGKRPWSQGSRAEKEAPRSRVLPKPRIAPRPPPDDDVSVEPPDASPDANGYPLQ